MTTHFLLISTVASTCTLAVGYALGGAWPGTLLILALGFLWLLDQWRGGGKVASVALVFFVGAAAVGLWLDLGDVWMLLGVVAALSAWDLDRFAQRQRNVGRVENVQQLERRHLRRLLIVDGLGLLLAAAGGLKIKVSFGAALLLALLAVLGLSRAVGFLRRESYDDA
jgi:hypothetical protein